MHDGLAHRLSLLATYAGAIEYRPDAPPEQMARAAGLHVMLAAQRDRPSIADANCDGVLHSLRIEDGVEGCVLQVGGDHAAQ